jgi:hypothetical protein
MGRRSVIAIGLAAVAVVAGVAWVSLSSDSLVSRSVDSGDGWTLVGSEVGAGYVPGSVEPLESSDGIGFRFVAATSTGGDSDCDPPRLTGSTRTESMLTIDMTWEQRGCADVGGEAFDLVVQDVPNGGLIVIFPIAPEQVCEGAAIYPDGSVAGCRS